MSKDQAYGGLILVIALILTLSYVAAFFAPFLALPLWMREWAVALPVFLFVVAVLVICMWIGWTMLTTPPPAPLEPEPITGTEGGSKEEKKT